MNLTPKDLDTFYNRAEETYMALKAGGADRVYVFYCGDLNSGFSNAVTSRLEHILEEEVDHKMAKKRFFSVFIEAVQNIRKHGCSSTDGKVHAGLIVYKSQGQLKGLFMNMVSNAQARFLVKRYDEVNAMTQGELKERYLKTLQEGDISDKGGAGLGIITIVMRSKNKSTTELEPLSATHQVFKITLGVDLV